MTTGNRQDGPTGDTQQYGEAMVALDATTLAVKGRWSLPLNEPTPDSDWGTGPTLFTDSLGRNLVSAVNKNGILYAFLRDNLAAGPVWTRRIANAAAGTDPGAGGAYSIGLFDGQRLYYAGGRTTVNGQTVEGSVRALDPRTGASIWEKALPSKTYGALAGANGMLVVPSLRALRLLDPATGEILYENPLTLYAAATVADGRLFVGDVGGVVHAYTYPASPGAGATTASIALARGCQLAGALPAATGSRVRVTRVGGGAPATVRLYAGDDCSGPALRSVTLGGGEAVVLRTSETLPAKLSVASSRAVRLRLAQSR